MSLTKVNTWSAKCQSSNGLKVTLVKKRKLSPEQSDVGDGSAEEVKPNQTVGLGGPRWTIESNRNPCKLVIKRRKTSDYPDGARDAFSSGEPSLKMRIVASKQTSQESETTFLRVKNWCKQQISSAASAAVCDNYLSADLQSSQPSPKCSGGLEGCLSAELFHLQPSPKDSGIDVSSPPRRLEEIHLADVSSCVAMAAISESATATLSGATSMVVSDVVMAMFSNVECSSQDGTLHSAARQGVGSKNALKTSEAIAGSDGVKQLGGRMTRRLSNLPSVCSYASLKALSAPEKDRIMLRLPSSMFRATVAGNTRTKNSPASSVAAGVHSRKRIGSVAFTETDASKTGAVDVTKRTGNSKQVGQILASVTDSIDSDCSEIAAVTRSSNSKGSLFARESRNKTKTSPVVDEVIKIQDSDVTKQVNSLEKTDLIGTSVIATKRSRVAKEKRSRVQIGPNFTGSNIVTTKVDPDISVENRSKDQTNSSISDKDRRITSKVYPDISIDSSSKDQTDPNVTEKDRSEAQTDANIIETDRHNVQTDPSFTEMDRVMEQAVPCITSKSRSKDQIGLSVTGGSERSKAHVRASLPGKMTRQRHLGPTHSAAIYIKDTAEQSHSDEKRSTNQGSSTVLGDMNITRRSSAVSEETNAKDLKKRGKKQTSSVVLGDMNAKRRACPVSEETNSGDFAVSDETLRKNQCTQRIVTNLTVNNNDQTCARISGEARHKGRTGSKADMAIRNKSQSSVVPVITEETRGRNVKGSAKTKELKGKDRICPGAAKEVSIKDTTSAVDTKKMKSQNETSPVDAQQTNLAVHASSVHVSVMRNNGELNLGCALELGSTKESKGGIGSMVSTVEIKVGDEVAKCLKTKSATEGCELIPEKQPKRNNSTLQARKWHAGSRNSASRRSYGRLCHSTDLPPPQLTAACSDPLRTRENSVESSIFLSRPHLLRERTAAYSKDEHTGTDDKSLVAGNGLQERNHQLSSLYDFEDDAPPVLESVNGRSIFPHRSRLAWKGRSVACSSFPSGPSADEDGSKPVSLMPTLVQSNLTNAVDLPVVEVNGSLSKSNVRLKTLNKSTDSHVGEFHSYVGSRQPSTNETTEQTPVLSASNVVQVAKNGKVKRPNVNVKRRKGLTASDAPTIAPLTENCSKYSTTSKKMVKPGDGSVLSKCNNLSEPAMCHLQTSEVQDICQAVTQDYELGLFTKEKCVEGEGLVSDVANATDCNLCTDPLRTVTYHGPVSENASKASENSVESEEFDFSLFILGQKGLARLQDKVTRLLRTVFPGVVDLCDELNIPVVCKLLDQLLDEMACDEAEGETASHMEACCCDCEVSLCRTPAECLRVFQRKVLRLLRILLPSTDLENVEAIEVELLVDAVTLANATELGEECCSSSSEKFCNGEPCRLDNSHIHKMGNASGEEHCCKGASYLCCCRQDDQKDLCCHGAKRGHDNLNVGDNVQCYASLTCLSSEKLELKSEESCIHR